MTSFYKSDQQADDYEARPRWFTNQYVRPGWHSESDEAGVMTVSRLYYFPIFVPETVAYDRIAAYISVGAAGLMRVGIYAWSNGVPGALILDGGTVDTTSVAAVEVTISQTLTRGYYFLAYVANAAASILGMNRQWGMAGPVTTPRSAPNGNIMTLTFTDGRTADVADGLPNPAPALGAAETLRSNFAGLLLREA